MLQIGHIYEFLHQEIFKDFQLWTLSSGVIKTENITITDMHVFTPKSSVALKILFYEQEPFILALANPYLDLFINTPLGSERQVLVTSEYSTDVDTVINNKKMDNFYYFFHGFAALDWYRGYHALNFNKQIVKDYNYDFISFNRIINNDRSYRIYFVSLLKEAGLLNKGLVSFNVTDNLFDDWRDETADPNSKLSEQAKQHIEANMTDIDRLMIDSDTLSGSASANIPRTIKGYWPNNDQPTVDAFWHIVTETVFYYPKLHLTEKIFKPIVSKQPFMLLAAPGNLEYLRSYGFKTFDGIIDESYDNIQDDDARIDAVVKQIKWYCNLSQEEKNRVIERLAPIVEYNFQHFYGKFKEIITDELLDNTKTLFKEIDYDDSSVNYATVRKLLTS